MRPPRITRNIHDYLIDRAGLDWESLLQEWHWLLPPEFRVWMLTRMADLFITLPDGSIHMLDVGAGKLQRVAQSLHRVTNPVHCAAIY